MKEGKERFEKEPTWVDKLSDAECRECLEDFTRYLTRFGPEVALTDEDRSLIAKGFVDLALSWKQVAEFDAEAMARSIIDGNH